MGNTQKKKHLEDHHEMDEKKHENDRELPTIPHNPFDITKQQKVRMLFDDNIKPSQDTDLTSAQLVQWISNYLKEEAYDTTQELLDDLNDPQFSHLKDSMEHQWQNEANQSTVDAIYNMLKRDIFTQNPFDITKQQKVTMLFDETIKPSHDTNLTSAQLVQWISNYLKEEAYDTTQELLDDLNDPQFSHLKDSMEHQWQNEANQSTVDAIYNMLKRDIFTQNPFDITKQQKVTMLFDETIKPNHDTDLTSAQLVQWISNYLKEEAYDTTQELLDDLNDPQFSHLKDSMEHQWQNEANQSTVDAIYNMLKRDIFTQNPFDITKQQKVTMLFDETIKP
eukprot:1007577_1